MEVYDAELLAIAQAFNWLCKNIYSSTRHVWVFTDNQSVIKTLLKRNSAAEGQALKRQVKKDVLTLQSQHIHCHLHWVSGHSNIIENDKAVEAAKKDTEMSVSLSELRYTSYAHLKRQIKFKTLQEWEFQWIKVKQKQQYKNFELIPHWKSEERFKDSNRLRQSIITQLKLSHEYFRSYLSRFSNYESNLCHSICCSKQDVKHVLLACKHYRAEQREMIQSLEQLSVTLKTLFCTKEDLKALNTYLMKTKVAIRKWILDQNQNQNQKK